MKRKITNKIDKNKIYRLIDQSMTIKEYFLLEKEIEARINYISEYIGSVLGYSINYVILGNGYHEDFGRFDPRKYNEFIPLKVYINEKERDAYPYLYMNGIPTRFLYEDFEQEVKNVYTKYMKEDL